MSSVRVRGSRAEVADLLAACVRDPDAPDLPRAIEALASRGRLSELLGMAERHRVLGSVARPLRRAPGIPEADRAGVEARLARQAARHLRVLNDLRSVAAALAGSPWFVAKGPVLAELLYPAPELRAYGDLDLFVPPERFVEAVAALEARGARVEDRNWALLRRERRGELHVRLALGTLADLHWHVINRGAVRDAFRVPMRELFDRALVAQVADLSVPVPEPTDALLHLGLHASLSGCNRLVWLQDIALMLATGDVDLEQVVRRARAWGIDVPVGIALDHAARVLGAPVPEGVLTELYGSAARRGITRTLARAWPPERSVRQDPGALWAQLARRTWRQTLGAIARRAARALRRSPDTPKDHATLRSGGDETDRAAFFAQIVGAGTPPEVSGGPRAQ